MSKRFIDKKKATKEILSRVVLGESIRSILKTSTETLPDRSTWYEWLLEDKELSDQYAQATEIAAEYMYDEMFEIADNGDGDVIEGRDGELRINNENIQRSRLRVDVRKWALSKKLPKKYGDKVDVTSKGDKMEGVTIVIRDNNDPSDG